MPRPMRTWADSLRAHPRAAGRAARGHHRLGTINADQARPCCEMLIDGAVAAGGAGRGRPGQRSRGVRPRARRAWSVRRWIPMSALLPQADIVAFHGGSGTLTAALAAGRPMLISTDRRGPARQRRTSRGRRRRRLVSSDDGVPQPSSATSIGRPSRPTRPYAERAAVVAGGGGRDARVRTWPSNGSRPSCRLPAPARLGARSPSVARRPRGGPADDRARSSRPARALRESGADDVVDAVAGATNDELDRRPPSGEWSAREIVHHVADSRVDGLHPAAPADRRGRADHPRLRRARVGTPAPLRPADRVVAGRGRGRSGPRAWSCSGR